MSKSPITCHVLDTRIGKPAKGIEVELSIKSNTDGGSGEIETVIGHDITNEDGRCSNLLPTSHKLEGGNYRIIFQVDRSYYSKFTPPIKTFFPKVEICFNIDSNPEPHYHIPLLLSPYSYTTYRGS